MASGRALPTFFGTLFALAGLGGTVLLIYLGIDAARTRQWRPVPCTLRLLTVSDDGSNEGRYRLNVLYEYTIDNHTFHGHTYRKNLGGSSDYGKVWAPVRKLGGEVNPAGAGVVERPAETRSATCFVDPANPSRAVLERGGSLVALFAPLPLLFAGFGAWLAWTPWRAARPPRPSRRTRWQISGRRAALLVFGAFFLVGTLVAMLMGGGIISALESRNWRELPCRVIASTIRTRSDKDGEKTYRLDIVYSYEIGGVEYRSNRYGFFGGSTSGYASKQRILARYPPGADATCFVDPDDPGSAVLHRGLTADMLFTLIPLAFAAIGAIGLATIAAGKGVSTPGRFNAPSRSPSAKQDDQGHFGADHSR